FQSRNKILKLLPHYKLRGHFMVGLNRDEPHPIRKSDAACQEERGGKEKRRNSTLCCFHEPGSGWRFRVSHKPLVAMGIKNNLSHLSPGSNIHSCVPVSERWRIHPNFIWATEFNLKTNTQVMYNVPPPFSLNIRRAALTPHECFPRQDFGIARKLF